MCELLGNVQKNNTIKHITFFFFFFLDWSCFPGFGSRFSSNNHTCSQRQVNKTTTMEWLTVDKTSFCLRGSAEGCHQNAEAEYDVTALCCGACRARRDVEIKLHPPALPSPFRLSRQNSSSHSKCEASGRGRGCLKTLCRVRRQTLITSNTDKSMVVKHTANCFSCPTVSVCEQRRLNAL